MDPGTTRRRGRVDDSATAGPRLDGYGRRQARAAARRGARLGRGRGDAACVRPCTTGCAAAAVPRWPRGSKGDDPVRAVHGACGPDPAVCPDARGRLSCVAPFFNRSWQSRASLAPSAPLEVRLERFEELSRGRSPGLLALSLWTAVALPRTSRPVLVVESAASRTSFTPRVAAGSSVPLIEPGEGQRRGVFALPPGLAADPESRYSLWLDDEPVL